MRPFEVPTADQFRALRAWLQTQGFPPAQVVQFLGTAPNGRAVAVLADLIRARLKTLPKAPTVGG